MADAPDIYASVREFDRCLKREYLETLSPDEAALLLKKIDAFNVQATCWQKRTDLTESTRRLIAAGCRLSSDLSEAISLQMMDLLEAREKDIYVINQRLRQQLRDRHLASQVLKKVHSVRNSTNHIGHSAGLGTVL